MKPGLGFFPLSRETPSHPAGQVAEAPALNCFLELDILTLSGVSRTATTSGPDNHMHSPLPARRSLFPRCGLCHGAFTPCFQVLYGCICLPEMGPHPEH